MMKTPAGVSFNGKSIHLKSRDLWTEDAKTIFSWNNPFIPTNRVQLFYLNDGISR